MQKAARTFQIFNCTRHHTISHVHLSWIDIIVYGTCIPNIYVKSLPVDGTNPKKLEEFTKGIDKKKGTYKLKIIQNLKDIDDKEFTGLCIKSKEMK